MTIAIPMWLLYTVASISVVLVLLLALFGLWVMYLIWRV
jgi:hypothetical protein